VASETSLHADLVVKAAQAGKMIALQKPLALTMPEADRMVAAVEKAGVPFTMLWQMRVDPQNIAMKEMIQNETLGKVYMVRRRHGLPSQLWDIATMWHFDPKLNRDIWADDSAHPIDMIHWLLGVPESVTAEVMTLRDPRAPMDNGIAIFRYPGGPLAEVTCSFTCLAAENTTEITCEKGSIIQNYGDVPSSGAPRPAEGPFGLKWFSQDEKKWTYSDIPSPASHGARIAGLSGPLAEFFQGRRAPIATIQEARTSLSMTLATYVSTREGRRVRLDDPKIAEV
jgi:predicted dehydrogenase